MSVRKSKRPRRGRRAAAKFVPSLWHLEDRTVPTIFYVDPALSGEADGAPVAFDQGKPGEVTGLHYASSLSAWQADKTRTAFSSFSVALDVANTNPGADTIRVATSDTPIFVDNAAAPVDATTGNALAVSEALTIQGDGIGATVLAPTGDTTFDNGSGVGPDNLTSVIRATADLTVADLSFDGAGKNIGFAFSIIGPGVTGSFNGVAVRNVRFDALVPGVGTVNDEGSAIAVRSGGTLNVTDSQLSNYGLFGVSYDSSTGTVSGSTLTGRGTSGVGTTANNGIQVIGTSTVLITGNVISGHLAAAASSGVAISKDPVALTGPAKVTLIGNTITGNSVGITVGVPATAPDDAVVVAQYNNITANNTGVDADDAAGPVHAENNWWGSPTGPAPTGLGNPVLGNVVVTPVLATPTPTLTAADVTDYLSKITVIGVAVSPSVGQPNPVVSGPVSFAVIFAQPVTGFTSSDVQVTAPAGSTPVVNVTGSGADYVVTVSGLSGVGPVSVSVPAGAAATANGFLTAASGTATVNFGLNTAPTISAIPNQTVETGQSTGPIPFTVGDAETDASALTVTAHSSNQTLLPDANIVLAGTGANRTITLNPVGGQTGTATVTVAVTDGNGTTTSTTFTLTATPVNTAPTISAIGNQTAPVGQSTGPIAFTVADAETPSANLTVTATSSDQAVVPNGSIVLGGSGNNRTIAVTPAAAGTATITVTVTDAGGKSNSSTFTVTGTAVAPKPALVGYPNFAAGPDVGGGPIANYYNPDGTVKFSAQVLASGFAGGVRVAVADFNGDGVPDLVVGSGPGASTAVRVIDGATQTELFRVVPFEPSFTGGVFVAAGDVTGDGKADLVITPDEGGGPRVRVFSGAGFGLIADFLGIEDPNFRGGARAAVGDLNGDGVGDLLVAAGFGGGPRVAAFNGQSLTGTPVKLFPDFFVFEQTLRNGVFVAAGDLDGDGFADVIVGGGPGGGPRVFALSGQGLLGGAQTQLANFFGGDVNNRGGIRIAVKNLDGDNRADLVVGAGPGGLAQVTAYAGKTIPTDGTPTAQFSFDAFPGFSGGVFVG